MIERFILCGSNKMIESLKGNPKIQVQSND